MEFLKRLLGLGGESGKRQSHDPSGLYFYVRCHRCGEVLQVRLDRNNDLSLQDDFSSYYARKVMVGTGCFSRMEAEFYFDTSRRLTAKEVSGGVFVEYEDYAAYQESKRAQEAQPPTSKE